nr:protein kinase-like domain, concanavalin A-like lectin/glucanase domain protein [Tanacetum cinerariifolium]
MSIPSQDEPLTNRPVYCIDDPEQAFVEYASSRTDEAGGLISEFMASQYARLSKFESDFKRQQGEMTNKIDIELKAITDQIASTLPSDTVKNPKLGTHPVSLVPPSPNVKLICTKEEDGDVMFIEIIPKDDDSRKEEPEVEGQEIMRRKLDPRENVNGGVSNFTGRIEEMHVFVKTFTYIVDFMIVEDISLIIDPRLSHIVLRKPFIE